MVIAAAMTSTITNNFSACLNCQNPYLNRNPRQLLCGHSFCHDCLLSFAKEHGRIYCKGCDKVRADFTKINEQQRLAAIKDFLDILRQPENEPLESDAPFCAECKQPYKTKLLRYCRPHSKFVCYKCVLDHRCRDSGDVDCVMIKSAEYCTELISQKMSKLGEMQLHVTNAQILADALLDSLDHLADTRLKLANLVVIANTQTEEAEERCMQLSHLLDKATSFPELGGKIAASKRFSSITEATADATNLINSVEHITASFYVLMAAEFNSDLSLARAANNRKGSFDIYNITVKEKAAPFDKHEALILDLVQTATEKCLLPTDVALAIVTVLKNRFRDFEWHAFVITNGTLNGMAFTPIAVQGSLQENMWFGIGFSAIVEVGTPTDHAKALRLLTEKAVLHHGSTDVLRQIAIPACSTFGGQWSSICGAPGLTVAASSRPHEESASVCIANVEYILFRHQ